MVQTLLRVKTPGQDEIRTTDIGVVLIASGNCSTPCHLQETVEERMGSHLEYLQHHLFIIGPSVCRCRNPR
uniref:CB5LP n=1 Tax=Arundo donax TaxID=35708 RepID=A0A0A9GUN8_ARUDO